jgi:peptidoglycan/xylan/chitin deacetylase (PgdA/CDA1 family)
MFRNKHTYLPLFWALLICLTASSCRSITRTRHELGIPAGIVIFSFDDGPNTHEDTTARLLEVLKKYDIRAMFALLGENVEHSPELARRIHSEGHFIINHGYSDKWAVDMSPAEFRENLRKGEAAIEAALGEKFSPKLYRPQGGYYKKRHWRIWRQEGYQAVQGSARAYDAVLNVDSINTVIERILGSIREQHGGLILLHDGRDSHFRMEWELDAKPQGDFNRAYIPLAAETIIIRLLEEGYTLTGFDITEILDIK